MREEDGNTSTNPNFSIRPTKDIDEGGSIGDKRFYLDSDSLIKRTSNCFESKIGGNALREIPTTFEATFLEEDGSGVLVLVAEAVGDGSAT